MGMAGAILAQDVGRDSSISKAKGEMQEGKSQDSLRIFNLIPSGIFPCRYVDGCIRYGHSAAGREF